ncbi:type II toxin-antitoxin system RelE/ParE family toxin [Chlorobium sp. KB01]|uniref:type II toxin-antitoxin system RelE/ParE family toxin n=1 Tax=Chlorobium sp. KB01 TaxID=1917528 RepID=UPI00097798B5|nr:type II toxin-antitoxin system RelE/ParE family toxin [Chlorobium sp. KB01]
MPVIVTRPLVFDDLADIWDYIAEDSPVRADGFIDSLDRKFHELAASPHAGRSRPELLPGLLSYPFGRYVIFYLVNPHGIEIVRVLHSARDIAPHFNPDE